MVFPSFRFSSSEAGVVLISVLLLMTLLLIVGTSALSLSRTDLITARNLQSGIETLWVARAGTAIGKNWLANHLPLTSLPVILGPTPLGGGVYTVEILALGSNAYRLTAAGTGSEGSRQEVEEIVRLPNIPSVGVILNEGDGLHPDFDDSSSGTGHRIPDFTIDGRNHGLDGTLSTTCPAVASYAVTQSTAHGDLNAALYTLKREVVTRANAYCQADGTNSGGGICTPGLSWVRGSADVPHFTSGGCLATDPSCFVNLDLSAAALRATAQPPVENLPPPPQDRGPFAPPVSSTLPFTQLLTTSEQTTLRTELDYLVQRIGQVPAEKRLTITGHITTGTHTYGTPEKPKVTVLEDGADALEISGGAVLNGVGILLVPRVLQLRASTVNWQGLVVIVGDGDVRADSPAVCGQIVGAVIIRDDAAMDRKFDLDVIERTNGCTPFAVNYSCEAVARALALLMRTDSRMEKFDG
jgi:hypothetical protein